MALTLQSELESKMQPRLQRLQIVEKRRKHHHLRSAVFVGSMIGAWLQRLRIVEKPKKRHLLRNAVVVGSTIGAAALVAVVVCGGVEARMAPLQPVIGKTRRPGPQSRRRPTSGQTGRAQRPTPTHRRTSKDPKPAATPTGTRAASPGSGRQQLSRFGPRRRAQARRPSAASSSPGSTVPTRLCPATRMYTLSASTQAGNASSIQAKKPTVSRSATPIA